MPPLPPSRRHWRGGGGGGCFGGGGRGRGRDGDTRRACVPAREQTVGSEQNWQGQRGENEKSHRAQCSEEPPPAGYVEAFLSPGSGGLLPGRRTLAHSVERDLESRSRRRYASQNDGCRVVGKLGLLDQDSAVNLVDQVGQPRGATRRHEQQQGPGFGKTAGEFLPARAAKYFLWDVRVGAARHHVEIFCPGDAVTDPVQGAAVKKTVGNPVRILFSDEITQWREIADEIGDDGAPVFCFGLGKP